MIGVPLGSITECSLRYVGYLPRLLVRVCGLSLETCTLFHTKICDFPYTLSELKQKLIPQFQTSKIGSWLQYVTAANQEWLLFL